MVEKLAAAGVPGHTPCALIARASTSMQQTAFTTLEKLPGVAAQAKPALLIVGEVVRLAKQGHADLRTLATTFLPAQESALRAEADRA
jgi:siroheme synthase